jgi:hypothetical protein
VKLNDEASSLAALFKSIRISWVPRKMNTEADRLVRDALSALAATSRDGIDGTRTRDLRRDRPVLAPFGLAGSLREFAATASSFGLRERPARRRAARTAIRSRSKDWGREARCGRRLPPER